VQPNTTYVVSVNVGSNFPVTSNGLDNAIVHDDISSIADGRNGVFGIPFAFPINSFQSSNYFRDVVFVADNIGAPARLTLARQTRARS
jgi:hypothetical protein